FRTYKGCSMDLVAWSQRRCVVCQCFLSNSQRRFCDKHGLGSKEYFLFNKVKFHQWNKDYRETHHIQELKRQRLYREKPRSDNGVKPHSSQKVIVEINRSGMIVG